MKTITVEQITALMTRDENGRIIDKVLHSDLISLIQAVDSDVQKEIDAAIVDHFVDFIDWVGASDRYRWTRSRNSHISKTQEYEDLQFFKIATTADSVTTTYTPIDRADLYKIFKKEKGIA